MLCGHTYGVKRSRRAGSSGLGSDSTEPLLKRSLPLFAKGAVPDSPMVPENLQNLALVSRKLKKDSEAESYEKRVQAIKAKEASHPQFSRLECRAVAIRSRRLFRPPRSAR
jgi:hypothetical protein